MKAKYVAMAAGYGVVVYVISCFAFFYLAPEPFLLRIASLWGGG
jgi:hypothetical protein